MLLLTSPMHSLLPPFLSLQIGALCLGVAALLGSAGQAVMVSNTLLLGFVLFSGFLANLGSITWALRWITYISPFRQVQSSIMHSGQLRSLMLPGL